MEELQFIDWLALVLVIVGALNWGLVGLFKFDLVKTIFGDNTLLTRTVYALVGLSGGYMIYLATQLTRQ